MDPTFFESLGDNCEFGFVQRRFGQEPGGLLRWAISPPEALCAALEDDFRQLYRFGNLVPYAPDMVRDEAYGLAFHSALRSRDGAWTAPEAERRALHAQEREKIDYMVGKLLGQLRGGTRIFTYKRNAGISEDQARAIGAAVRAQGPGQLIWVGQQLAPGTLEPWEDNIWRAGVSRFAPYEQADDVAWDDWEAVMTAALRAIP